ncbi:MAG TPA: choice-of-anchor tandem repeat GloVer-containing protein [Candidatus Sulfotelmatobacter sp.]
MIIFRSAMLAAILSAATLGSAQTVTTLYSFAGNRISGANPFYVTLVQGTNGNLYGTTYNGGANNVGTIFSVNTAGQQKVVYSFKGGTSDGANPTGGLTLGTDGNFYGTTQQGGTESMGTVFKMTPAGAVTILHNFNTFIDGAFPWNPPTLASDGNFYGTTSGGGENGRGIVYKITSSGTLTTIYKFDVTDTHGFGPIAPPTQGSDGNLYIPVAEGGTFYCGTILKMSTAGVIGATYDFPCGAGGSFPIGPLVQASNGNFYSTTQDGGTNGEGVIYQVTPSLGVTVLHSFGATFGDGTFPSAGMLLGTDGNYYGSTSDGGSEGDGTLFNTSTSGTYASLYSFNNTANLTQTDPLSPPVQYTDGNFYGVTEFGGTSNDGTVYSLDMGLAPFVNTALFSGKAGATVTLLGTHLKGATKVTFNGAAANFKVLSDTHLSAIIPAGASTGPIEVTTAGAVLQSRKNFVVKP